MLSTLRIQDIVLVEQAEVHFREGFNVITGETGAGKSAILRALALVLGQRADSQSLRKGAEKGIVEAAFDTDYPQVVRQLLEEGGISYELDEPLILRREITAAGKSKAFINNQLAQVSLLRNVGEHLVEIVGQHSNQELRQVEQHRAITDAFAGLGSNVQAFQAAWKAERAVEQELNTLIHNETQRIRQAEEYQRQLEELDEAAIKEGEEEELFAEYSRLTNADELRGQVDGIYQVLSGEDGAALPALSSQMATFSKMAALDSSLEDARQAYQGAVVELQEVARTLRDYGARIESDPQRASMLDDRLALISKLKKKYGPTVADVLAYHATVRQQLSELDNADMRIEELKISLEQKRSESGRLAQTLTDQRTHAAKGLGKALAQELRSLNMPKVDVQVNVSPVPRHNHGEDHVEVYFAPNVGEKLISVKDCASGGELSRLVLALKALMAGKAQTATLVFDEVDANIGGETATVVGQKLANIGAKHQLVCITHFPQVARHAHQHIQISKNESKGRTRTLVKMLDGDSQGHELQRMLGGE